MLFKIFAQALFCLPILVVFASAQCPLVSDRGYAESSEIDYNYMFHWGTCQGPSCPNGNSLYLGEGRGNNCPDEPATVWMSRNVQPAPKQGIVINYTVRGNRSGYLFRFGYIGIDCSGIGDLYDQYPYDCLPCDVFFIVNCEDRPGEGSRSAECSAQSPCTASCVKGHVIVDVPAWDNCPYQWYESHHCEAWAYTTSGGINNSGAFGGGANYYNGAPYCWGTEVNKCNGYYYADFRTCACPNAT